MDDSQHERALTIARTKLAGGDYEGAKRFAKKALAMNDSPQAYKLLDEIEKVRHGQRRLVGGAREGTGPGRVVRADLVPLLSSPRFQSIMCCAPLTGDCLPVTAITLDCLLQPVNGHRTEPVRVHDACSAGPLLLGARRESKDSPDTASKGGEERVHPGADDGCQAGQSVQDVAVLRDPLG